MSLILYMFCFHICSIVFLMFSFAVEGCMAISKGKLGGLMHAQSTYLISFVICLSVASGNSPRRCSNIRS